MRSLTWRRRLATAPASRSLGAPRIALPRYAIVALTIDRGHQPGKENRRGQRHPAGAADPRAGSHLFAVIGCRFPHADPPRRDRVGEEVPVALGLFGIGNRERRDGFVKIVAVADIGRDRDRIAGAGMGAGQGAAAQCRIKRQCGFEPGPDIGETRILEPPDIKVTAVDRVAGPAKTSNGTCWRCSMAASRRASSLVEGCISGLAATVLLIPAFRTLQPQV